MNNVADQKVNDALQNVLDAFTGLIDTAEKAVGQQVEPALYDLRHACQRKGVSYDTVRKAPWFQPLMGFSNHTHGTKVRLKPYWTDQQVNRWLYVMDEQRTDYARELLYGEDREIAAGVLSILMGCAARGELPMYMHDVVDEAVDKIKEATPA